MGLLIGSFGFLLHHIGAVAVLATMRPVPATVCWVLPRSRPATTCSSHFYHNGLVFRILISPVTSTASFHRHVKE